MKGWGFLEQMKGEIGDCLYYRWRDWRFWGEAILGRGKRVAQRTQRTQRFKGMEDDEIAGVVGEWGFALDRGKGEEKRVSRGGAEARRGRVEGREG